ncbi:MAG: DUF3343 domain-containing protein [Actinomycetota bacterium]|nr:DUF3343 domain-containing protein [Actinomycetota bacterium]
MYCSKKSETLIIVFESTNLALKTEKLLRESDIPCTVIPAPIEVTTDCGLALLINEKWKDPLIDVITAAHLKGLKLLLRRNGEFHELRQTEYESRKG